MLKNRNYTNNLGSECNRMISTIEYRFILKLVQIMAQVVSWEIKRSTIPTSGGTGGRKNEANIVDCYFGLDVAGCGQG